MSSTPRSRQPRRPSTGARARPSHGSGRTLLATAISLLVLAAVWAQPPQPRLVAIGDIHGAGGQFTELLQRSALLDDQHEWVGERATLVQTGDFTDRGPDVRAVMDLLMRLEKDADAHGGQVRVLLGNHETMNLTANVRDVTPEIFASFQTSESAKRREAAYLEYEALVEERSETLGRSLPDHQTRSAWMEAHPLGFVEYMEALGPSGPYGRWLRSKPIITVVADTLFLHGGLSPQPPPRSVEEMNRQARDEIERFDRLRHHLLERGVILAHSTFPEILTAGALELNAWAIRLFPGPPVPGRPALTLSPEDREHLDVLVELQTIGSWSMVAPDGPLWFRGFALWSSEEGNAAVSVLLKRLGVTCAVVGHSVTPTRRITPRFSGRVFLIDTGMLAEVYQGQASALELVDGRATAIYLNERAPLSTVARRGNRNGNANSGAHTHTVAN